MKILANLGTLYIFVLYICVYIYVDVCVCICVCMYVCVYICIYMYMCICVCVCMCVCIYMCIYIYICYFFFLLENWLSVVFSPCGGYTATYIYFFVKLSVTLRIILVCI